MSKKHHPEVELGLMAAFNRKIRPPPADWVTNRELLAYSVVLALVVAVATSK